MGLHRGTKRGTIYPDRVKSLLESKWEQGFGENFLKRYFNLEGFFKKTGFFDRFDNNWKYLLLGNPKVLLF